MIQANFEKLQKAVAEELVNVNDFYVIDFDRERIRLQGDFTKLKLNHYSKLVDIEYDKECGWFIGKNDEYRIVLTLD